MRVIFQLYDELVCLNAVKRKANEVGLAVRLAMCTPDIIRNLLAEGKIEQGRITLVLNATELACELILKSQEIDPAALQIEASFALRRRGVEGKIVVGDREPAPDQTLLRALYSAHVWTKDLRSGRPVIEIAAATGHSDPMFGPGPSWHFFHPRSRKRSLQVASHLN